MLEAIILGKDSRVVDLFTKMLGSTGKIKIIGKYTNDDQILNDVEHLNPGVAFIEVPGINGMKTAIQIRKRIPCIKIVFISEHERHAVEAYEVGAIDFILMPFKRDRICKMINRLSINSQSKLTNDSYMVCCFRNLHFKYNGKEIKKVKWRTSKAKELFTLLVQNRRETMIRKDILVDLLWPNQEADKAFEQLYCTIYQIRRTLKSIGVNIKIVSSDNGYELVFNNVRCDVDEWEREIESIPVITEETLQKSQKLIEQYTGDYLAEETYVWKENEQERLRVIYQSHSNKVLNYLCETERYTEASLLALRNQRLFPYLQHSYFLLMRIYAKFGDIYNVDNQYVKLVEMLKDEFGTIPNKNIRDWYAKWVNQQKSVDTNIEEINQY